MGRRRARSIRRCVQLFAAVGFWPTLGGVEFAQPTSRTTQRWVTPPVTAPRLQQRTFESAAAGTSWFGAEQSTTDPAGRAA